MCRLSTIIVTIVFIIIASIANGCKGNGNNASLEVKDVIEIPINNPIETSINNLIAEYDTIRLEVSSKSLLSDIAQVQIMNDKLYVTESSMSMVFIYTLEGKYISKICNQGEGPKEYIKIYSFELDPANNRLLLTDTFSKRLFIYDESGNLQDVISLNFMPERVVSDQSGRFLHIKASMDYENNDKKLSKTHIQVLNNKGDIEFAFLPDESPNHKRFRSIQAANLTKDGEFQFMPPYSNIIYRIHGQQAIPVYTLTPKNGWDLLSKEDKKEIYFTVEQSNIPKFEEQKKMFFSGSFFDSDSLLFISSGWKQHFYTLYSKTQKAAFTITPEKISGNKGLKEIFLRCPLALYGGYFYIDVSFGIMSYALNYLEEGKMKFFLQSINDEEGNPCIIRYKFNQALLTPGS